MQPTQGKVSGKGEIIRKDGSRVEFEFEGTVAQPESDELKQENEHGSDSLDSGS